MKSPGPAAAGFTLIEVMISMFFLAFIVGEMAMISTYARRSTAHAQRLTEANMLAEAVLEKSRNTAWNNLPTAFSALDTPPDPITFDIDKDGDLDSFNESCATAAPVTTCSATLRDPHHNTVIFQVSRTVTPYLPPAVASFAASTAADIAVQVAWTDAKGGGHQISVATVRTKF